LTGLKEGAGKKGTGSEVGKEGEVLQSPAYEREGNWKERGEDSFQRDAKAMP